MIGVGNPDRGDDAVGRAVVRHLRRQGGVVAELVEHPGEATGLMALLQAAGTTVIVDAAVSETAPPGTLRRIDAGAGPLPSDLATLSSHGLGLAQAIELARALGVLPARCILVAVEARSFGTGEPLSPEVAAAVGPAADLVRAELRAAAAAAAASDLA